MFTGVRWLRSATITLLPDNRTVSVLCDVNESSPPVSCLVTVNCTTCELVISKVFTGGNMEIKVIPDNSYVISVQAIRTDTERLFEDYSVTQTISVPRSTSLSMLICNTLIKVSIFAFYCLHTVNKLPSSGMQVDHCACTVLC